MILSVEVILLLVQEWVAINFIFVLVMTVDVCRLVVHPNVCISLAFRMQDMVVDMPYAHVQGKTSTRHTASPSTASHNTGRPNQDSTHTRIVMFKSVISLCISTMLICACHS